MRTSAVALIGVLLWSPIALADRLTVIDLSEAARPPAPPPPSSAPSPSPAASGPGGAAATISGGPGASGGAPIAPAPPGGPAVVANTPSSDAPDTPTTGVSALKSSLTAAATPAGPLIIDPGSADADRLADFLARHGHLTVRSADAVARLAPGDEAAGRAWGLRALDALERARAALTRLDRAEAGLIAGLVGDSIQRHGGGAAGAEPLVEWCLLERQLSLASEDPKGASAWLDAAVAVGPDTVLDPARHPDEERDALARRQRRVHAESPVRLSVTSVPTGADVWVDGVRRCPAPCSVGLPPGRHFARVTAPSYAATAFDVHLTAGGGNSLRADLSPAYRGESLATLASWLTDPQRRGDGAAGLARVARFLDVDRVVGWIAEGSDVRVVVAPPYRGRSALGPVVPRADLPGAVLDQLRPPAGLDAAPQPPEATPPFYARPLVWLGAAGVVGAAVAAFVIYSAGTSSDPPPATLTVRSAP